MPCKIMNLSLSELLCNRFNTSSRKFIKKAIELYMNRLTQNKKKIKNLGERRGINIISVHV